MGDQMPSTMACPYSWDVSSWLWNATLPSRTLSVRSGSK